MNYGNVMEKDSSVTLTFIVKHNINRSNLYSKIKKKYEPNETNIQLISEN